MSSSTQTDANSAAAQRWQFSLAELLGTAALVAACCGLFVAAGWKGLAYLPLVLAGSIVVASGFRLWGACLAGLFFGVFLAALPLSQSDLGLSAWLAVMFATMGYAALISMGLSSHADRLPRLARVALAVPTWPVKFVFELVCWIR